MELKKNNYYVELSKKGIEVFKGGNIEVMKKVLINFNAENLKEAEKIFLKHLNETVGSASEYLYTLRETK